MDATRPRRTRDPARQKWYASCRQWRFARFMGFDARDAAPAFTKMMLRVRAGRVVTVG